MATAAQSKPIPVRLRLTRGQRARTYAEYLLLTDLGKLCYKAKDVLLESVLECPKRETQITIKPCHIRRGKMLQFLRREFKRMAANLEGKSFAVRDKFAERNSIPVGQNARRFEIEEI